MTIEHSDGREMIARYGHIYTISEMNDYCTMVAICHDFVDSYRAAHPDQALLYFDALKLASPEYSEKARAWSVEHNRRVKEYEEMTKNWGVIFR